jgi:hypothetical protein
MSLISRLLKSSQVRDCEAALKLLRPNFDQALFYEVIERRVSALIRKNPEAVQKKILLDGQTAQVTVLHAISNIAFQECASGMNHTYRGVLSMEGHSHQQVYKLATAKLLELGAIDEDGASAALADLGIAVKEAG